MKAVCFNKRGWLLCSFQWWFSFWSVFQHCWMSEKCVEHHFWWKFLLHWMSPLRYCWPMLVLFVQQFGWYEIISEKKTILLKLLTWWCSDLHCSLMARTLWVGFWPRARFACCGGFYSGFPPHWKDMHSWPVKNSKLSFGGGVAWTKPSGCNHSISYMAF